MKPLASEPATPSPYLTASEAAAYLRYASVASFYKAIATSGIPVRRRGRSLLFHRAELDRWLAGESRSGLLREARSRHTETVAASQLSRPTNVVGGSR